MRLILAVFVRYYADPKQPKVAEQQVEEPVKKQAVQIDPEQLLREAEEQAEEAGNDQVSTKTASYKPATAQSTGPFDVNFTTFALATYRHVCTGPAGRQGLEAPGSLL